MLRKPQEQAHGGLKAKYKMMDQRYLPNEYLLPLNRKQLASFGLPESFKDMPRLNYIATVCCSL